jgi:hypothetical protein
MKIGLDIHGVIDRYPELFKKLSKKWSKAGHKIHIVTGQEWESACPQVHSAGINYHEHFSIVDYHKEVDTEMYTRTDKEGWWMDKSLWNSSKGNYAFDVGLDIHFDDSLVYANYFPADCTYIHVSDNNFEEMFEKLF